MRAGLSCYRALPQDAADSGNWIAEAQPAHLARLLRESLAPDSG